MSISVAIATSVDDELVEGLNLLLPQLSSSAPSLDAGDLEALVQSPSMLFIARDGGAIVGTLTLVVFTIPTGIRAWIEDVVVDESTRGRGAGEALAMAAIDEATRRGVKSIDLTSRPSRVAANALYVKLGFELRETNVYRISIED